jgi:hypothetical protein
LGFDFLGRFGIQPFPQVAAPGDAYVKAGLLQIAQPAFALSVSALSASPKEGGQPVEFSGPSTLRSGMAPSPSNVTKQREAVEPRVDTGLIIMSARFNDTSIKRS